MTTANATVTAHRLQIWALVLPGTIAVALSMTVGEPTFDWRFAISGAHYLLSGHLSVYADMPQVQMGPLSLLLAGVLPGPVYLVAMCALLPLMLWMMTLPCPPSNRTYGLALTGGLLLAWPWAVFAVQGHGDDALVMVGVVAMVLGCKSGREAWVIAGFLVAIAGKPTAILFLPLAFVLSRRAGILAAVGGGMLWAPFVLANVPGFLAAGRGQGKISSFSVPDLLGGVPYGAFPAWVRPAQLIGGAALCIFLARRSGPAAAVAGVFALRVLLEPATWNYYSTAVIAAAILLDLNFYRRMPWGTLLAFVSFIVAFNTPAGMVPGVVRIVSLTGVLILSFARRSSRTVHGAEPIRPPDTVQPVGTSSTTRTDS